MLVAVCAKFVIVVYGNNLSWCLLAFYVAGICPVWVTGTYTVYTRAAMGCSHSKSQSLAVPGKVLSNNTGINIRQCVILLQTPSRGSKFIVVLCTSFISLYYKLQQQTTKNKPGGNTISTNVIIIFRALIFLIFVAHRDG